MELYVLRHGMAADSSTWSGSDFTRTLTPQGERQVREFLEALHARGELPVAKILASPLVRAQQTAQIAGRILGAPVETLAELASGASPGRILKTLEERADPQTLLLVGHNPDLSMLIAVLAGSSSRLCALDCSGLARLEGELAPGAMRLCWKRAPGMLD